MEGVYRKKCLTVTYGRGGSKIWYFSGDVIFECPHRESLKRTSSEMLEFDCLHYTGKNAIQFKHD